MKKIAAFASLVAAFGLAGCATDPTNTTSTEAAAPADTGEVVTGSRLPRKATGSQPVKNVSKEDWTRSQGVIGNAPRGN